MKKTIKKAYTFRLYPNEAQARQINKTIGCARFIYNYFLARRKEHYAELGESLSKGRCSKMLTELKRDRDLLWLREADKFALQNSLTDLERAYTNFFDGRKKGEQVGFPKFKKKHKAKQKYRTNLTNNNIAMDLETREIKLPKLGWVRFQKSKKLTELPGQIVNATITHASSGKYFVSVLFMHQVRELPESHDYAGYDLGLKTYAFGSNGDIIENPRYLKQAEKKLARLQRSLSRKKKKSRNFCRQRIKVARQHERVANMRKNFLDQESTRIVRENQVIVLEDLKVKNMVKNRRLSKSMSDASWGTFRRMIEYKGRWYGRTVVSIDKFYPSSKLCSVCGEKNPMLTLSVREWACPHCGTVHDRDENAAINILNEGLRLLAV